MANYQCISCGAVKESKKACSCPTCGYKMFATPYDRAETLANEIKGYVKRLEIEKISKTDFELFRTVPSTGKKDGANKPQKIRKEEDDSSFPTFKRIQEYVCTSEKSELFYARLTQSVEQIRAHLGENLVREYEASFKPLKTRINSFDAVLKKVMKELQIDVALMEKVPQGFKLQYQEMPDVELLPVAEDILGKVNILAEKIRKFIKQNNMYGSLYQNKPSKVYKPPEDKDYLGSLKNNALELSETIKKKYAVDIFSDGSAELNEMLTALWISIEAVMAAPVRFKKYIYLFDDGTNSNEEEICQVLEDRIKQRYAELDATLEAGNFLKEMTEDQMFSIYDKMIETDSLGLMGIDKTGLLKIGESEKKLDELIGLSNIKDSIKKIKAYALANKEDKNLNIHMCFLGNPGSGKTEVARYIAGILYENKILPSKKIVEVDRSGLVSQYFGATAEKTQSVIQRAMGGVLFIDEAYALANNADSGIADYGKEAIDTLVKAMEDYRGKFCVILAGYKNEMQQMLAVNPGFRSRIQFVLEFPNYSREELRKIMELMLEKRHYTIGNAAMNRILDITDIKRKEANFANAREIRNILDQAIMCQNLRTAGSEDKEIGLTDINKYIKDARINLPINSEGNESKILTGEEELEQLIGLDSVKRMVKKIKAYAKRNKDDDHFNLHMCFYGNPGTGKTEVARVLSRILFDAGVLSEAKLVETDGRGLIGKYIGETAPKTEAKINEAMGGVLFIDEAYMLLGTGVVGGKSSNYGEEAIAVLLKEMEDRRGQFCVILAGYKEEMKGLLDANPGFESRIQFSLDFPDYTRDELGEIANVFMKKKKYSIDVAALERILDITDYYRNQPNFANARTVRNILNQVIMNQNLRTEDIDDNRVIILEDVEDYIAEEKIDLNKFGRSRKASKIGFA